MSVDGSWLFYEIDDKVFPAVRKEFEAAASSARDIVEIIEHDGSTEDHFDYEYIRDSAYHEPFEALAYRLICEEESSLPGMDKIIDWILQSRVLPPVVLYIGIGKERFSQLPGFFGNTLLHSSEIEEVISPISATLDIGWKEYFDRAVCTLDYGTPDGTQESRDVSKILHVLPETMRVAKDNGTGLLPLTSWGVP